MGGRDFLKIREAPKNHKKIIKWILSKLKTSVHEIHH